MNKRKYIIYIDENIPSQVAKALNELQQPQNKRDKSDFEIRSIKETFGGGCKDEDWIPEVGKENAIVITQDCRIQTLRHQNELYKENGVGILFIHAPAYGYWDLVKKLINSWDEIKGIIEKNAPPFAFRCTARGKFEKLN